MLRFENDSKAKGYKLVIGVDEAGRGPLAGPVVASAVILKSYKFHTKVFDSKQLSALAREKAFDEIYQKAYVGLGIVSEGVIDSVNILEATYIAMSNAIRQLLFYLPSKKYPSQNWEKNIRILVDGNSFKTQLPFAYKTIVEGDARSLSIAAASIVAKVTRDRILQNYSRIFPHWGFEKHKGYPTREHRAAIKKFGHSPIHRLSFHHS